MRCLILGATGQIGSHLVTACDERGLARLGTYYRWRNPDHAPLDLLDAAAVEDLIGKYRPDVTFLAAGLTGSGYAEAFPDECRAVVEGGTRAVAEAVAAHGGRLVSFHSDELFGESKVACKELDPAAPQNAFARAHHVAEECIRGLLPERHLIIRTSWVFGADARRRNVAYTVLRKFRRNEPHAADPAAHGHPTYAPDLADVAVELARLGETGTIHLVGPDRQTAYTFAHLVAQINGFDTDLVTTAADPDGPRPNGVWLDRTRMRQLVGPRAVRPTADGLRGMRAAMRAVPARAA